MIVKMIDPPSGWRYGFPRVLPDDVTDLRAWYIKCGYPEKDVDFAMEYSRSWFEDRAPKEQSGVGDV